MKEDEELKQKIIELEESLYYSKEREKVLTKNIIDCQNKLWVCEQNLEFIEYSFNNPNKVKLALDCWMRGVSAQDEYNEKHGDSL